MHVVLELLCASIYMYGKLRILLVKDSMGYILGVMCVGCACLYAWRDIVARGRMSKNSDTQTVVKIVRE